MSTAEWQELVERELRVLAERGILDGLWRRDPATWVAPSPGGTPADDATGWLDLPGRITGLRDELTAFADDARADGLTDVVLLGMGGSSLGPLVLGEVFGVAPGYLRLHVLDSTVPGQIAAVRDRVNLARTMFLVSSKSGTTIEPLTLMDYFRWSLDEAGVAEPDTRFAVVTDPGTPLETLAGERGFRKVFSAPPDLGGRFSVLSVFGLVPAALIGVDLDRLAESARQMAQACGPGAPVPKSLSEPGNPGAALGATLGALAAAGRGIVTVIASPRLASFGVWVEQLLAESTGKNGRGLVPVSGEPGYAPGAYGNNRDFVYARLEGDDNAATDAHAAALEEAGHPVTRLELDDVYALGAEFFRWEVAVAVSARAIDVYPFDQPDVESAKEFTRNLLAGNGGAGDGADGAAPESSPRRSDESAIAAELIRSARPGDYVAIVGYVPESDGVDRAVGELRAAITSATGAATTFGYGPRYLHSTGQLQKGGPNSVVVVALAAGNEDALAAPGADHDFDSLFKAQLEGDVGTLRANGRRAGITVLQAPYDEGIREIASALSRS